MNPARPGWWRGARGEWYVAGQTVLFLFLMFGPRSAAWLPSWPPALGAVARSAGILLLAAGTILLFVAVGRLGNSLTALPAPKPGSRFVAQGPYAIVRHPIYAGVLLMAFGGAFAARGTLMLLEAVALLVLLGFKAAREERWLVERYPEYRDYQRRVRKLIPFIY
ncbi:MAG: isoprenylcysteine carboxylmethyltransferase family protein [Gemmatimonadales bacterium]